ncbi:MAG: hypothetical protein Q8R18_04650 [bacterium]|nr:hypothetical protein [bacterium]
MKRVHLEDLLGIPNAKRKEALRCLNDLLKYRDETGKLSPIITGYNGYVQIPSVDRAVTFSHIHEDESYRKAMFSDLEKLGYSQEFILSKIRDKTSASLWELDFQIKGADGCAYSDSVIKYIDTEEILDLSHYSEDTLEDYPELEGKLYSENGGWELDFPFKKQRELLRIVHLFTKKAYRKNKNCWPSAYEFPVLLLGEKALLWKEKFPDFTCATKMELIEGNNELSFIINRNLINLKMLPNYQALLDLGFRETPCLGNIPFIKRYIDKIRKV